MYLNTFFSFSICNCF